MAALGWHAINDSIAGPSTPGTAYVLLHDHAAEQAGGGLRTWGFVRDGIGRVTEAMADAAREAGAEVRTGAEVERVIVGDGRGDAGSSSPTGRSSAPTASSRTPTRCATFFGLVGEELLPDRFAASLRNYRCEGTSVKINLASTGCPR